MNTKKLLSLLLCLALLCALMAGCSKTETPAAAETPAAEAPAQEAPAAESAPAEEAPAEEAPAQEAPTQEAPAEQAPAEPAATIAYPLSTGATYEVLREIMPNVEGFIQGWEEHTALPTVEEKTGVKLTFISPSTTVQSEQFQLMIASGDYPDIFNCGSYNGGLLQAGEDEVIVDLTDLLDENAPDYLVKLASVDIDSQKATLQSDGHTYAVYSVATDNYAMSGPTAQGDWMEAAGMDSITTVDQLVEYARFCMNTYGITNAINAGSGAMIDSVAGAYGLANTTSTGAYLDGDTVKTCSTSDNLREYLVFFNGLYNEGIINGDFFNAAGMPDIANTAYFMLPADQWVGQLLRMGSPEGKYFVALPALVKEDGDTNVFGDRWLRTNFNGGSTMSISTQCANPAECLQFMNWFFTDDGYIAANYGTEGYSFDYDAEGTPIYTDVVTDNATKMVNCFSLLPASIYQASFDYTYPENVQEAVQTWVDSTDCSAVLPTVTYTDDENMEYTNITTDLGTYAEEAILKFAIGNTPINDDTWAEYCDTLEGYGLSRAIELTQAAYDRYLAE